MMDFNLALISLILLINIQGFLTLEHFQVNCEQRNICALKETNVTLKCFYSNINITTGFWFSQKQRTNWREKDEPEDLTLDLDYSGRVKQLITNNQSQLTISDLRERDSGEYQLMFIMKDGVKRLSSVTVSLTVTVLQVKKSTKNRKVKLTCETSCTLTSRPRGFYWKRNGLNLKETDSPSLSVSSKESASYSCFLSPDLKTASAPVCLSNSNCWNVSYASRRVCALVGSTVDINSTYSHPTGYTVEKTYWHFTHHREFRDLREKQHFAGRVEYLGNTLRIKDVKMSDSGEYRFRFITDRNAYSGSPGVILAVTDTEVKSSPATVSEGEKVILSCLTKCILDKNTTFFWYKNGRLVTDGFKLFNKLYLDSVNKEEIQDYSCSVGGSVGDNNHRDQDKNTATPVILVMLSVLLVFAFIGVLMCRWRKFHSSSTAKEAVQPGFTKQDNTTPLPKVSDFNQKIDSQQPNIHYSSIHFKQSHKTTSSTPNVTYSSTGNVVYATVMVK